MIFGVIRGKKKKKVIQQVRISQLKHVCQWVKGFYLWDYHAMLQR